MEELSGGTLVELVGGYNSPLEGVLYCQRVYCTVMQDGAVQWETFRHLHDQTGGCGRHLCNMRVWSGERSIQNEGGCGKQLCQMRGCSGDMCVI
jgi:hypothetical protein